MSKLRVLVGEEGWVVIEEADPDCSLPLHLSLPVEEMPALVNQLQEIMRRQSCQRCGLITAFRTLGLCDSCVVECQEAAAARGEEWP